MTAYNDVVRGALFIRLVERAHDVTLTRDNARDLATILVCWNQSRHSRGLPPLTLSEGLSQVLRVVREDVEAGIQTEREA